MLILMKLIHVNREPRMRLMVRGVPKGALCTHSA